MTNLRIHGMEPPTIHIPCIPYVYHIYHTYPGWWLSPTHLKNDGVRQLG